jgi:hypothetical protein
MRYLYIAIFSFVVTLTTISAQTINIEKVALTNYLIRMYEAAPFDGVRVVKNGEQNCMISIVRLSISKYNNNMSVMDRIATTKATSQASQFVNGTQVGLDVVMKMNEGDEISSEYIEIIQAKSAGYINSLELLTSFEETPDNKIYIYYRAI